MPITRSDLVIFATGVAAGAAVIATYPKWKGKLEPLLSGVLAGAGAAFGDVSAVFEKGAGETAGSASAASAQPSADFPRNGAAAHSPLVI